MYDPDTTTVRRSRYPGGGSALIIATDSIPPKQCPASFIGSPDLRDEGQAHRKVASSTIYTYTHLISYRHCESCLLQSSMCSSIDMISASLQCRSDLPPPGHALSPYRSLLAEAEKPVEFVYALSLAQRVKARRGVSDEMGGASCSISFDVLHPFVCSVRGSPFSRMRPASSTTT